MSAVYITYHVSGVEHLDSGHCSDAEGDDIDVHITFRLEGKRQEDLLRHQILLGKTWTTHMCHRLGGSGYCNIQETWTLEKWTTVDPPVSPFYKHWEHLHADWIQQIQESVRQAPDGNCMVMGDGVVLSGDDLLISVVDVKGTFPDKSFKSMMTI